MAIVPNVAPDEIIESSWGNTVANELNTRSFKVDGTPPVSRIRLTAQNAGGLASTLHAFQIGPDSAENLIMDPDDVQCRNSGAAAPLRLNINGGQVTVGAGGLQCNADIWAGGGNLLAGKMAPDLNVVGAEVRASGQLASVVGAAGVQNVSLFRRSGADVVGQQFVRFARGAGGTGIGAIVLESPSSVAYQTTSDYRLKDELGPVVDPVERFRRLRPIHYRWRDGGGERDGFLAHEVAEVVPDAVSGTKDAVTGPPASADDPPEGTIVPQGMENGRLIPLLVATLQTALDQIDALTARITQLEGASA